MRYRYRVRYDGTLSSIEVTEEHDPDGYDTFGEAKAELLGHLRSQRDQYAHAVKYAASLTAQTVKAEASNAYGVEF